LVHLYYFTYRCRLTLNFTHTADEKKKKKKKRTLLSKRAIYGQMISHSAFNVVGELGMLYGVGFIKEGVLKHRKVNILALKV